MPAKESPPKDPTTGKFISTKSHSVTPESEIPDQLKEKPKPEPVSKKEETAEELEGLKSMAAMLLGQDEKWDEGEVKKPDPEKKKEVPKAKSKPATKPTPEPEPEAEVGQKLNTAELPKLIAEAVAAAVKQPDKKEPEKETLSEEDELTVSVLKEMEQRWPKKYPKLSERYLDTQKALVTYAKKWATDNPGQEFDEEAPEHEDFYKTHDVDWDDTHFNAALAGLEARRERDQGKTTDLDELRSELKQLKNKDRLRDAVQAVEREQGVAAKHFWQKFNGEYQGILQEDGEFNMEKLQSLRESDPEGLSIRAQSGRVLQNEVAELYKLMGDPDQEEFTPYMEPTNTNPLHQQVAAVAIRLQEELTRQPKAERLDEHGRDFKPFLDYWRLPKEQRKQFWTVTAHTLALLRANELAASTQTYLDAEEEKFNKLAKKRGLIKDDSTVKPRTQVKPEPEEEADEDDVKPKSPTSMPSSKMAAAGQKGGSGQKPGWERFVEEGIIGS